MQYPPCLDLPAADLQASNAALLQRERTRRSASYTCTSPYTVSAGLAHPEQNRYSDILPYDRTLVKSDDYVNANWVEEVSLGQEQPRKWIAAQAPLQNTLAQFWQVFLLPDGPGICIMLTGWTERGIEKCFPYFDTTLNKPLIVSETLSVTLTSSTLSPDASYKVNMITLTTPTTTKEIKQIEYLNWPDHGVPTSPASLLALVHSFLAIPPSETILVHCSAGVGRTGTFIAISNLLRYIDELDIVQGDVVGRVVDGLREARCCLVQTGQQLEFVRECLRVAWRERKG